MRKIRAYVLMYLLRTGELRLVEDCVSGSLLGCCSLIGVMLAEGEAGASKLASVVIVSSA